MNELNGWGVLNHIDQINQLIEESTIQPVVIFKHSVSCGISANAKHRLEKGFSKIRDKTSFYYLDLLANRNVSNAVAKQLNVTHQSPQIIVIDNKEVVHTSSHFAISVSRIREAI